MYKKLLIQYFLLVNLLFSCGFMNIIPSLNDKNRNIIIPFSQSKSNSRNNRNERNMYSKYLLGLRKTRRILLNNTNINTLSYIINFTNEFVANYTQQEYIVSNTSSSSNTHQSITPKIQKIHMLSPTHINNTDMAVKQIMMGNIVLDVSNVKHIHISTKKDDIIIELDKKEESTIELQNILENINNLDAIVTTITMIGKIMNLG